MATAGGAGIVTDGLVLSLDGASRRSTLKTTQVNNILNDPGNWSTGTGGQSGYGSNGSSSEQNRVSVTDDPWGRTSITWRTTPDSTSGADGGWNSSYYAIDRSYAYRWSIWVRRYTTGTGGTFYLGLNPAPIRNDNGASQGNPYFTCPSIASLTYNQWYLVVGHVFYEGYTGGRHPDSGWYENGIKISDKSFCNMGSQDGRWASTTTTSMLRAYHYYTTNVNSGIEFAYPRVDKIDGKEPSISEMINRGESGWLDLTNDFVGQLENGLQYSSDGVKSSFNFDGTNDHITGTLPINGNGAPHTIEMVFSSNVNQGSLGGRRDPFTIGNSSIHQYSALDVNTSNMNWYFYGKDTSFTNSPQMVANQYYHIVLSYAGGFSNNTNKKVWINGVQQSLSAGVNETPLLPDNPSFSIGRDRGRNTAYWPGKIPVFKVYDRALSQEEAQQNYNAYKNRFNL